MRRKFWIILMAVLFVACVKLCTNGKIVEVIVDLSKSLVHDSSVVGFSANGIDSLFNIRHYKYFMFVDDTFDGEIASDSVLVLARDSSALTKCESDLFLLPESALDYFVNKDTPFAIYTIKEITKRENGNMYRLRKME